jgi:hypothetical protein
MEYLLYITKDTAGNRCSHGACDGKLFVAGSIVVSDAVFELERLMVHHYGTIRANNLHSPKFTLFFCNSRTISPYQSWIYNFCFAFLPGLIF